MNINSDEIDNAIWWILQKIKKTPKVLVIDAFNTIEGDPELTLQWDALQYLTYKRKVITCSVVKTEDEQLPILGVEKMKIKKIEGFDQIYDEFKHKDKVKSEKKIEQSNDCNLQELKNSLEQRFSSFINEEERLFFSGLSNYVELIIDNNCLKEIVDNNILNKASQWANNINELYSRASKECDQVALSIYKDIKKNKINIKEINQLLQEYTGYKTGRIKTTDHFASYHILVRLITILFKNYKELVTQYVVADKTNFITGYKISPLFQKLEVEIRLYKEEAEQTTWGAWEKLEQLYKAGRGYTEWQRYYSHYDDKELLGLNILHAELNDILGIKQVSSNVQRRTFFKQQEYKCYINNFHYKLIEILKQNLLKPKKVNKKFDSKITSLEWFRLDKSDKIVKLVVNEMFESSLELNIMHTKWARYLYQICRGLHIDYNKSWHDYINSENCPIFLKLNIPKQKILIKVFNESKLNKIHTEVEKSERSYKVMQGKKKNHS